MKSVSEKNLRGVSRRDIDNVNKFATNRKLTLDVFTGPITCWNRNIGAAVRTVASGQVRLGTPRKPLHLFQQRVKRWMVVDLCDKVPFLPEIRTALTNNQLW